MAILIEQSNVLCLQFFIRAFIFKNIRINKMYQRFEERFTKDSQEAGIEACGSHDVHGFPIFEIVFIFSALP